MNSLGNTVKAYSQFTKDLREDIDYLKFKQRAENFGVVMTGKKYMIEPDNSNRAVINQLKGRFNER